MGSKHGVFVNSKRQSERKKISEFYIISNNDIIQLGDDADRLKYVVTYNIEENQSKNRGQVNKAQIHHEPKKYGMSSHSSKEINADASKKKKKKNKKNKSKYEDRAAKRRKLFVENKDQQNFEDKDGMDVDGAIAPAQVSTQQDSNANPMGKGRDLLKKMGWNEGEIIGKTNVHLNEEEKAQSSEPLKVYMKNDARSGLGFEAKEEQITVGNPLNPNPKQSTQKQKQMQITMNRYYKNE